MRRHWWVWFVVAVTFGCPKVEGTDAGVEDAGVDHCRAFADTYCQRLITCGIGAADARPGCVSLTLRQCRSALALSYAGATAIDPAATAQCLQTIDAAACPLLEASTGVCLYARGLHLPNAKTGERCEGNESCVSQSCEGGRCGTCGAAVANGEPCGACASGSFCNSQNLCEAKHADGNACRNRDECSSDVCNLLGRCGPAARSEECRSERECASGDFCLGLQPSIGTPGRCQARTPSGAVCQAQPFDSAWGCEAGTWCLDGRCVAPAAGSLAPRAECVGDVQCRLESFCEVRDVEVLGRCAAANVDSPCIGEQQRCPTGARCITGVCRALRARGEPCTIADDRWDDCLVGLACVQGVCAAPVGEGEACERAYQCVWGTCPGGSCQPPGAEGASCLFPSDCRSRACVFSGLDPTGRCAAVCI